LLLIELLVRLVKLNNRVSTEFQQGAWGFESHMYRAHTPGIAAPAEPFQALKDVLWRRGLHQILTGPAHTDDGGWRQLLENFTPCCNIWAAYKHQVNTMYQQTLLGALPAADSCAGEQ
jgi:hypothetical protein